MILPYVINRKLEWNGEDEIVENVFPHKEDGNWRLMLFECRGVMFYLHFSYSASKDSFIIYLLLGDSILEADKYKAKIWLQTFPDPQNPDKPQEKIGFLQKVVSIENTRPLDGDLPNSEYLVIPYSEMKKFFSISKNEDDPFYPEEKGKWTVAVPIQVQDILNVT